MTVSVLCCASACALVAGGLPEGTDPPAAGGASTGATGGSAGDDSGSGGSAGVAGVAGTDAGMDAGGAGGSVPDAAEEGCCDCDGDKADGPQCGGDDCDDNDPDVFPGQTKFFATQSKTQGYDYNCDKVETREFTTTVQCVAVLCDASKQTYLAGPPPCGGVGDFGYCTFGLPTCNNVTSIPQRPQGCR